MEHGRKWSKVAKYLGGIRTEHMVKNRYKALIKTELKKREYQGEE